MKTAYQSFKLLIFKAGRVENLFLPATKRAGVFELGATGFANPATLRYA